MKLWLLNVNSNYWYCRVSESTIVHAGIINLGLCNIRCPDVAQSPSHAFVAVYYTLAGSMATVEGITMGQPPDVVVEVDLGETQERLSDKAEGENEVTATAADQKPKKKKKKRKKPAGDSVTSRVELVDDNKEDSGACAIVNGIDIVTDNPAETHKKEKKKKKAAAKDADAQVIPKTDMLLLYDGTYKEPTDIKPVKKQTYPPSIPICELYPNGEYPKGLEMPYSSSDVAAQQRVTSEEKRALERAQADLYNDIRQAAEAHRHIRKYMQTVIKPGRTMIDICTELENYSRLMINEKGLLAGKQNLLIYNHASSCCNDKKYSVAITAHCV